MKRYTRPLIMIVLLASWSTIAGADVKTVTARQAGADATAAFRFKGVPAPSATDLGGKAKFSLLDGRADPNGGGLTVLNDGKLPTDDDQPAANFFFNANTDGGRLLTDLGAVSDVKQINTYSWHRAARGPQLYKLYASDGSRDNFNPRPPKDADLQAAGWTLLASVDTRPKDGEPGGQYGVSIGDPAAGGVGKYRYLLFDISRTESDDPFGNTFFSEIDVLDGKDHAPAVADSAASAAPPFSVMVDGKYEIVFDTSDVPELKEWVETKLKPACVEWYPKIVEMLPSDNYTAPTKFSITIRRDARGVAYASGTRITCAADWFKKNLEGEAVGAVVHELVHVVQQYRRARGGNQNPGWLVEGLADYIRWFLYEPESKRPRVNPARAKYTDSYRTTGAFLNYLMEHHDKEIVKKLKTVDELWADYVKTLPAP